MPLHVSSFGGGVALLGAADTRATDELLEADSLDIGVRGSLVCSAGVTPYLRFVDAFLANHSVPVLSIASVPQITTATMLSVVLTQVALIPTYAIAVFNREGDVGPIVAGPFFTAPAAGGAIGTIVSPLTGGVQITTAAAPGVYTMRLDPTKPSTTQHIYLLNIGAREGQAPRSAPGLYVIVLDDPALGAANPYPIQKFDALGTGPYGSYSVSNSPTVGLFGTHSQQLYFTGICSYNGYVFGWGFDSFDLVNGDGPCRVMFCNLSAPLAWGKDNLATGATPADRVFTDSDAIVLGSAGERIRAAIAIYGRLFFATNRGLHYLQGYGRDTFITNGTTPVVRGYNCVGPFALVEGPDRVLYGVGDQGLWSYDGLNTPQPLFQKVTDFSGRSVGWFDLIWTDPSLGAGMPGKTNSDLVWMTVDWFRQQVLIGIPYCNASTGVGAGSDTVVIRYHPRGGGFTRQVFTNATYTSPGYFRRELGQNETRFLVGGSTVARYAYQPSAALQPVMPAALPSVMFGPYAPFGPDGEGLVQRLYLTLAWADADASLPLYFAVSYAVDQVVVDSFRLTVGPTVPTGPVQDDCWFDTSLTDTDLGNAGGSLGLRPRPGYLLRVYNGTTWFQISGSGQAGSRATIPLLVSRVTGARMTLRVRTLAAGGRFEIEGLGFKTGEGEPDA